MYLVVVNEVNEPNGLGRWLNVALGGIEGKNT